MRALDELVKLVSQKTGLSEEMAKTAVETVVGYLKGKLPAPIAGQIDGVLGGGGIADLARIHGIAGVFSDLLENAGVDTVKELATRNPDNLHAKLMEVNAEKRLAGRTPNLSMANEWVAQAKELPKVLEY